jgi:hypothetical protein
MKNIYILAPLGFTLIATAGAGTGPLSPSPFNRYAPAPPSVQSKAFTVSGDDDSSPLPKDCLPNANELSRRRPLDRPLDRDTFVSSNRPAVVPLNSLRTDEGTAPPWDHFPVGTPPSAIITRLRRNALIENGPDPALPDSGNLRGRIFRLVDHDTILSASPENIYMRQNPQSGALELALTPPYEVYRADPKLNKGGESVPTLQVSSPGQFMVLKLDSIGVPSDPARVGRTTAKIQDSQVLAGNLNSFGWSQVFPRQVPEVHFGNPSPNLQMGPVPGGRPPRRIDFKI